MKIRIAISLAVLVLVALAVINKSTANTTNARSLPASHAELKGSTTPAEPPTAGFGATCFCKVTANGTEIAKLTKGGYVQPLQAGKCQDYCKGLWDSPGAPVTWAHQLPNACGNVTVKMEAALGTMSYTTVRGPDVQHGINGTHFVTTCSCPSGQTVSNTIAGQKYCLIAPSLAHVPGVPDSVNGAYAWNNGYFYQTSGPQHCVTACQ
jgi:hypothetical protein